MLCNVCISRSLRLTVDITVIVINLPTHWHYNLDSSALHIAVKIHRSTLTRPANFLESIDFLIYRRVIKYWLIIPFRTFHAKLKYQSLCIFKSYTNTLHAYPLFLLISFIKFNELSQVSVITIRESRCNRTSNDFISYAFRYYVDITIVELMTRIDHHTVVQEQTC